MKREAVVESFLVCDENSYVLVRWRKIMPSRITVLSLHTGTQTVYMRTSTRIENEILI